MFQQPQALAVRLESGAGDVGVDQGIGVHQGVGVAAAASVANAADHRLAAAVHEVLLHGVCHRRVEPQPTVQALELGEAPDEPRRVGRTTHRTPDEGRGRRGDALDRLAPPGISSM